MITKRKMREIANIVKSSEEPFLLFAEEAPCPSWGRVYREFPTLILTQCSYRGDYALQKRP